MSGRPNGLRKIGSSDGVRLALHDLGGDGSPLVICHATGFCGMAYEPLGAELTGRFHVFAVDFRGHGDSTPPAGDHFYWQAIAGDLLAVLDALGGGPATVFGHSLGGAVSLLAAARRPGAIDFAYLYEPIVLPDGFSDVDAPNALSDGARRRRATFPTRADAMLRYAGRPPLDTLQARVLAAYVEHGFADAADGSVRLKCEPEHEAATFDAPDKPLIASLGAVDLPAVVAAGVTRDRWSPGLFAPAIAEALPGARYELHPTLGHLGPLENPSAVAQAVLAAVAERPR